MFSLFSTTRELVMRIDYFIDLVGEAVLHFNEGLKMYLSGDDRGFSSKVEIVKNLESRADDLLREIEAQLYVQTLIPESREDVLILLEGLDDVIDHSKNILLDFYIEKPDVPDELRGRFEKLGELALQCSNALTQAARSYFYEVKSVKDSLHRVKFYESESDYEAKIIKEELFALDMDLGKKLHIKNFIRAIDYIPDKAEATSNHLSIAAMKRIV